jgi:hypothetical protein
MVLNTNRIIYPKIYYRILIYLFSAHFIVSYGEPENFIELLKLSYYYLALVCSFIIAAIIGEYILKVTRHLDASYLSLPKFNKRISYQVLWGVIATVLIALLLAALYFWLRGTNIIAAGYFRYDFTIVLCYILLLNALYLIIALTQQRIYRYKINIPNKEYSKENVKQHTDILAIYPVEGGFVAMLKNGESIIWTKTIEETIQELPESECFLINRSDIVHREIIEGYQPGASRRLLLILKVTLTSNKEFYVSQRKVVGFKHWYKEGMKNVKKET